MGFLMTPSDGQGDADGVVEAGPEQILAHDAGGPPGKGEQVGQAAQVVADEGDVGGAAGDLRSRPEGDADIGLGQRGRVVDAVTGHGDDDRASGLGRPRTRAALSAGSIWAVKRSMPTARATACVVAGASPLTTSRVRPSRGQGMDGVGGTGAEGIAQGDEAADYRPVRTRESGSRRKRASAPGPRQLGPALPGRRGWRRFARRRGRGCR